MGLGNLHRAIDQLSPEAAKLALKLVGRSTSVANEVHVSVCVALWARSLTAPALSTADLALIANFDSGKWRTADASIPLHHLEAMSFLDACVSCSKPYDRHRSSS
jgi:hypothetical protein